jgi:hypothetical protein
VHAGLVELPQHEEEREHDAEPHGHHQPGDEANGRRDQRHHQVEAVDPPEPGEVADRHQAECRDHDERAERRLGQVVEHRGEEQRHQDRQQRGGQAAELGAGPRLLVDGGLGEAARPRQRLEERPRDRGGADRHELLAVVDLRLGAGPDRTGHGHRLQEHHEGDGEGSGEQGAHPVERRQRGHRQTLRHLSDDRDAPVAALQSCQTTSVSSSASSSRQSP